MERNLQLLVGHRAPCSHLISTCKCLWSFYKAYKIHCALNCVLFAIKSHESIVLPVALTCLATWPFWSSLYSPITKTLLELARKHGAPRFQSRGVWGAVKHPWATKPSSLTLGSSAECVSRALSSWLHPFGCTCNIVKWEPLLSIISFSRLSPLRSSI